MSDWLSITIAVVGLVSTILGILGVSAYVGEKQKHKAKREIERSERDAEIIKKYEREQYLNELNGVIVKNLKPIQDDLTEIKRDLNESKAATIANLRATMKSHRDKYMKQGYADIGDKATWKELYEDYRELGGNHFREYVNAWYDDVASLPDEKQG